MRVLLDNRAPVGIANALTGHTVTDAVAVGLAAVKNGDLLSAAERSHDVLVTCDQNMQYQQNLANRKLAIVAINTNHWPTIKTDLTKVSRAVDATKPGSYQIVSYPKPPLRRRPFTR